MKFRLLSLFVFLSLSSPVTAEDTFVEQNSLGLTDWENGYVEAVGEGTSPYRANRIQEELMAKQAARTVAQARLLELIKGIRLTGLSTVGEQALGNTRAATRIKGTLRGARVTDEQISWHKDKTSRRGEVVMARVTLRVCISPLCSSPKENGTTPSLTSKNAPASNQDYSAVIIDLEKALFLPALAPQIIDESGQMIYSQDSLSPNVDSVKGLVHYTKSVKAARALAISGPNPLIIRAQKITADNRIVLDTQAAQQMASLDILKQGRVIVALD